MAKAEVSRRQVEYRLTLSEDEATALRSLIGNNVTCGGPTRKLTNAIYDALADAGVHQQVLFTSITTCIAQP